VKQKPLPAPAVTVTTTAIEDAEKMVNELNKLTAKIKKQVKPNGITK
jgi:hypothetical protein